MAKWLKLYATYTFSTSPNLCNRTTLLNTDVQNCYITLEFITIRLRVQHPPYNMKKELQLKCLKKINAQELTVDNKNRRERLVLGSFWTSIRTARWTSCFFTDKKLFIVAAPTNSQNDRFLRPSKYQKEELQWKPTPSNEIDIQQVSRWTLDRWMPDSQSTCNKFQCYVTI